jgi:hypothetical protein
LLGGFLLELLIDVLGGVFAEIFVDGVRVAGKRLAGEGLDEDQAQWFIDIVFVAALWDGRLEPVELDEVVRRAKRR